MSYKQIKLGMLGGGQLGRMLIQAATDWNVYTKVLDATFDAPCHLLASEFVCGSLTDFETVYKFGQDVDVLTIEIENVNVDALEKLEAEGKKVFPQPHILRIIQDKRTQKQFYKANHIPTSNFVLTDNRGDVRKHVDLLPTVHKLGKGGYDGRGVQKILSVDDLDKAFDAPGILEELIDFEKEITVIITRNQSGEIKTFPIVEPVFHSEHNLVEYLFSPAQLSDEVAQKAIDIATKIVKIWEFVGILAVEFFVTKAGEVLVNEVAPRPHNSGHQTIESCYTSQYQQHIRAIFDFPLGSTKLLTPSAMINLLGEKNYVGVAVYQGMRQVLNQEGVFVHLYGKTQTKPLRKMGHITIIASNLLNLHQKVDYIKGKLKVISE